MKKIVFMSLLIGASTCAMAAKYGGKPFKVHNVPCTIEAEDYDLGGEGVAFHYQNKTEGNRRDYREDPVCIASANGGLVLSNTNGGNWTNYTINVTEAGDYAVDVVCAAGGDNGSFDLRVDGVPACRVKRIPNTGWSSYTTVTVEGVHLKKGRHVLQWYTNGGMNFDKMTLRRTGALTNAGKQGDFNYKYPITMEQTTTVPMFLAFPSQLYEGPFTGNMYTADPSAHTWTIDGREVLYVYASHDMEPAVGCDRMDRYHIFSTEDMRTWTDHGEIVSAADVKKKLGVGSNGFMWAPDAAYNKRDGKYYFIFPHKIQSHQDGDAEDVWAHFLAVSDTPHGPFKLLGYIKGVTNTIDPCLFVDDDGEAYVFVGGGGVGCYGGKLKRDNWLELDGGMKKMEGLNADFHEAPFLFKKDGKYYMTHSDNNPEQLGGNQLMYAIGDSPLGPWRDGGVYMLPHAEETAHGSIVQFKGRWYQFWHNANYSGRGNLRSVCCSPVTFAEDGSINIIRTWGSPKGGKLPMLNAGVPLVIEAEDYNDGGSQVGFFKRGDNQTYTFGKLDVQPMKVKTDGGVTYIADMQRKEWARWSFFATETGTHTLRCRVRNNGNSEGRFYVGIDGHWTAREEIKVTSKAGEWTDIEVKDVRIAAGEHFLMWRAMFGNIDVDRITIE